MAVASGGNDRTMSSMKPLSGLNHDVSVTLVPLPASRDAKPRMVASETALKPKRRASTRLIMMQASEKPRACNRAAWAAPWETRARPPTSIQTPMRNPAGTVIGVVAEGAVSITSW